MPAATGSSVLLAALAALAVFILAVPRALAVEGMRQFNKDDSKESRTKNCPRGERYSEKKRDCVKTSCGTGQVWSGGVEACLDSNSAALTDDDLYLAGRDLGQEGHYKEALQLFFRIKDKEQARVLSSIGYSTRKLGDLDKGIDYYHQALTLDPNYTKAREYLGEGYLQKGDLAKAKEQLAEIGARCSGGDCTEYAQLEKAIVVYVTGDPDASTW
jgi:tetratricopeptide (TPR) repeat protein